LVHASLGKNVDPISKITRTKRAEVVTHAVNCMVIKREALSSNSNTTKKEKEMDLEKGLDITKYN
jgi:hypothetical protein